MKNILEYLEATALRLPDKIAFSDGCESLTFAELQQRAMEVGSEIARLGYANEGIAVLAEKKPTTLAFFFGCLYAGCFYVPVDPEMPEARTDKILQNAGCKLLLCDEKHGKTAQKLQTRATILLFSAFSDAVVDNEKLAEIRDRQIDTDPAYIVFTSGSTGVPKGVCACHRSVIDYTEALCRALPFAEDTVFGNQTPLFFDAPLKEIMPTLKLGATVYLIPKVHFLFPMKLCDYLNEHRINTVCWVVSALTVISSLGALEKNPPRYLRLICFGSEVFPRLQYDLWRKAYPNADFFNLYGPTEATGMSCYWKARELAPEEPIPVGRPFDNTGLFLVGEDGNEAKNGDCGEIYLRGTCVTLGYFRNEEKTREAFVQNPLQKNYPETVYRTGDLGRFNERGELVFLCRKDAQIKLMGHRIELGEIEAAASELPQVTRACCVFRAEEKKILLYVTGSVNEEEIRGHLQKALPRYMMPGEIRKLAVMPLTPNGKLDRKKLAEEG